MFISIRVNIWTFCFSPSVLNSFKSYEIGSWFCKRTSKHALISSDQRGALSSKIFQVAELRRNFGNHSGFQIRFYIPKNMNALLFKHTWDRWVKRVVHNLTENGEMWESLCWANKKLQFFNYLFFRNIWNTYDATGGLCAGDNHTFRNTKHSIYSWCNLKQLHRVFDL